MKRARKGSKCNWFDPVIDSHKKIPPAAKSNPPNRGGSQIAPPRWSSAEPVVFGYEELIVDPSHPF
jgi:hypothetical protein